MTTHRGSCHCGRVRFEVDAEIDHVRVCDCSICRRRGALNFRVPKAALRLLTPWEELSLFEWGTRAVNVRCLEDVDLARRPVERISGSKVRHDD